MDLVLINPGGRNSIYQDLADTFSAVEPPIWAGLIASFIRIRGFTVSIIDANALQLSPQETALLVEDINPQITAIIVYGHQPSASTQNMTEAGKIVTAIKWQNFSRETIMIGGHVAALPEQTMLQEVTDYCAEGEGLFTLLDLLKKEPNNKVRGLWYRNHGKIVHNASAPLLQSLDTEMPGVSWDLLPMEKYRSHNWHAFDTMVREPYAAIYTSLGCPFHCTFCCIQAPFKSGEKAAGIKENISSYRLWSPQTVIGQIGHLVNRYGIKNIKIADEMFVLNPRHVAEICDLIIDHGYDLNIWAYARIDTIKDSMLEKLKKAGVNWLAFGIEAADSYVRDSVDKHFDQEEIYRVIKKVQEAGIHVIGNYIFGLPEDNYDTMKATLDMAVELNCEFANFYCTMAYPGSPLFLEAIKNDWPLPEKWSGFSQHSVDSLPLPTKYLTSKEVVQFRDEAFQAYFTNPRYLNMISDKFGLRALEHINVMTSNTLVRNA